MPHSRRKQSMNHSFHKKECECRKEYCFHGMLNPHYNQQPDKTKQKRPNIVGNYKNKKEINRNNVATNKGWNEIVQSILLAEMGMEHKHTAHQRKSKEEELSEKISQFMDILTCMALKTSHLDSENGIGAGLQGTIQKDFLIEKIT